MIWGDRASGHPAPDPSTAGRDVGAGVLSKAYCLTDVAMRRDWVMEGSLLAQDPGIRNIL